jgi:hypothetical protein
MSGNQIVYAVILSALTIPAWGRQRYALLALWCNLVAILAICLAMDIGALDRSTTTLSIMIADLATGALLATSAGLPRVIALGYAITVPLYAINLVFGVPINTTFAIIYIAAFAQLGVLAIGSIGGDGGGNRRGRVSYRHPMALSVGNTGLYQGPIFGFTSEDRGP